MLRFLLRFLRPRFERRFVLEYGEREKKKKKCEHRIISQKQSKKRNYKAPNSNRKTKKREKRESAYFQSNGVLSAAVGEASPGVQPLRI